MTDADTGTTPDEEEVQQNEPPIEPPIEPPVEQPIEAEAEVVADAEVEIVSTEDDVAEAEAAIVDDINSLERERDEYLDALRRLQADFENYKKRMMRQQTELLERAGEGLVEKLLPVLDAVDLARQHGVADGVEPIANALVDALAKEGLERIDPVGQPFDPNEHEAVAHEPADPSDDGKQVVANLLRAGYRWKGKLLRPAMVSVRG